MVSGDAGRGQEINVTIDTIVVPLKKTYSFYVGVDITKI